MDRIRNTVDREVLKGEAVFVYDTDSGSAHAGVSAEKPESNKERKFDYVQELLDQVVPRKRSVTTYTLTNEDGVYDDITATAVETFRREFNVPYDPAAKNIINKLKKDYPGAQWEDADWAKKIIDKNILVGKTDSPSDVKINNGVSVTDTGLYELYRNVVVRFIEAMITEGERYVNATGFQNTDGNWKPRTYNTADPANGDPAQTQGVSYCFGCKDTVEQFIEYVSSCAPPDYGNASANYRGRINEASNCAITGGSKGYPGLRNTELNVQNTLQPYWPTYWAGIDCAGFVQRLGLLSQATLNSTASIVNTMFLALERSHETDTQRNEMHSGAFTATDYSYYSSQRNIGIFDRGDFIIYDEDDNQSVDHISLIYCIAGDDTGRCDDLAEGEYRIMHASGMDNVCRDVNGKRRCTPEFDRKVIIHTIYPSSNMTGNLDVPMGYGRINLWN